ncbi:unnamed protein product [Somion occarium]|uniref:DUF6534 domain-containing protein n=1 Tax=Somion occarium TaxID=3059160 RepID=A0ABP1E4S4_9APHY
MAQSFDNPGVRTTLGAVLLGSFVSVFLSGCVAVQVALYYRTYARDRRRFKFMVASIWILDLSHTTMVCITNWMHLIDNFGNHAITDRIAWSVSVSIAITAILTFFAHCFFAHRIFALSKRNWFITVPILILATGRIGFALVTTTKMLTLKSYSAFVVKYTWSFTLGLSLATAADILIAASLCWYLNKSRTGFSGMDTVIDSITLYTIETGLATCITTVVALVCWLTMSHNLIFLGLHFAISKLYSNTFLATLNARNSLRGRTQASRDHELPVLFADNFSPYGRGEQYHVGRDGDLIPTKVQISVEKTIEHDDNVNHVRSDISNTAKYDDASVKSSGPSCQKFCM